VRGPEAEEKQRKSPKSALRLPTIELNGARDKK